MAMISTETVNLLLVQVDAAKGDNVLVNRTTLRGILSEIRQLQGAQGLPERQKMDFVQKLTLEFSLDSIVASIKELAKQEFPPEMSAGEALIFAADRLEKTIKEQTRIAGGTA